MMYNTIQKPNSAPHKNSSVHGQNRNLNFYASDTTLRVQVNHCKKRLIIRRSQFVRKQTR